MESQGLPPSEMDGSGGDVRDDEASAALAQRFNMWGYARETVESAARDGESLQNARSTQDGHASNWRQQKEQSASSFAYGDKRTARLDASDNLTETSARSEKMTSALHRGEVVMRDQRWSDAEMSDSAMVDRPGRIVSRSDFVTSSAPRTAWTTVLGTSDSLAPVIQNGSLIDPNEVLTESQHEYEEIGREVRDLRIVFQQSRQEVSRLNQRKVEAAAKVSEMEQRLQLYPREEIREIYLAASEAEMRAFMISEHCEHLESKIQVLERYQTFLQRMVQVLTHVPAPAERLDEPRFDEARAEEPSAQEPRRMPIYDMATSLLPPLESVLSVIPDPSARQFSATPAGANEPAPAQTGAPARRPARRSRRSATKVRKAVAARRMPRVQPKPARLDDLHIMVTPDSGGLPSGQSPVARRVVQAQEGVRAHVAGYLQEHIMQPLVDVALSSDICARAVRTNPASAAGELDHLRELVQDTLHDATEYLLEVRPAPANGESLAKALRRYVAAISAGQQRAIEFTGPEVEEPTPPATALAAYRVAQEAVMNALRHSGASTIRVSIAFAADGLAVAVEDDGKGFDVDDVLARTARHESMGILSMLERAEAIEGILRIHSTPGLGTRIELGAPLK